MREENPDETVYTATEKEAAVENGIYEALIRQFTPLLKKWKMQASPFELYDKIGRLPYGDRIAGYFLLPEEPGVVLSDSNAVHRQIKIF